MSFSARIYFFKTFHKIHIDSGFFGGKRLDRFTSYQLGLFDETRIRGVPSTAVRFKELILARTSYSFNVFNQFRFELFYDRVWGDAAEQRLERVSFGGLGVGMNIRGPWHTIIRGDIGKSFLPEALRGGRNGRGPVPGTETTMNTTCYLKADLHVHSEPVRPKYSCDFPIFDVGVDPGNVQTSDPLGVRVF